MAEYIERTEELVLAMNAGARAIENTRRYHGAIYNKNVFSEDSQEIPYLLAAKVLRGVEDAPAADVAPVVHGYWIEKKSAVGRYFECSNCGAHENKHTAIKGYYCWRCGAKMDGGADNDTN